jgi:transcriptional regulator with XRE-family HTH domain
MYSSPADKDRRRKAFAATVRSVRLHRGIGVGEMAKAMNMPLRSYQHFEAGRSRLNVDQLFEFAAATRSDPIALFKAVILDAPDLAIRSADNKLVSAITHELEAFNESAGDAIKTLRSRTIVNVFRQAFDTLEAEALRPDPTVQWISDRINRSPPEPSDPEDDES